MNHPGGSRFEARPAETDSLLQTLLGVCNRYGVQKSAASFLAGLPSTERLSVEHGTRAMQAAGFAVKLVKRDPSTLPNELLPAVLLNKDGTAFTLLSIDHGRSGPRFEIHEAGPSEQIKVMTLAELRQHHGGHCMLIKQLPKAGEAGGDDEKEEVHN